MAQAHSSFRIAPPPIRVLICSMALFWTPAPVSHCEKPFLASQAATMDGRIATPMSARERKQIYMHSAIFENRDPAKPALNVYNPSRQQAVIGEIRESLQSRPAPGSHIPSIPSPAD